MMTEAKGINGVPLSHSINRGDEDHSTDTPVPKSCARHKQNNAVPNYLRASTGSCHDACKYGTPREFKTKPWHSTRRKSTPPMSRENTLDVQIYVDKRVDAVQTNKLKSSSDKEPSPDKKVKNIMSSSMKSSVHSSANICAQPARSFTKSPSPKASTNRTFSSGKEKTVSVGCLKLNDTTVKPSFNKTVDNARISRVKLEVASVAKKEASTDRTFSNAKRNVSASVSLLKPNSTTVKQRSETKTVENARTSREVKKVATQRGMSSLKRTSKVDVTPNSDVKTASFKGRKIKSPKNNSHISQASYKNELSKDKVESMELGVNLEERTLHMIETRENSISNSQSRSQLIQSPSPLSPESFNSSSQANSFSSHEMRDSEHTDSDADESASNHRIDSLDDRKRVTHNGRNLDLEDQDPRSMKLRFRRGKVVELQSETDSPRQLRFRKGRILEDNQGVDRGARRINYKSKANDSDKGEQGTTQEKVVLKHQNVETKNDTQVLLNNVIEQTANKLVEIRKSKVKALVGAFETVISLQERKPSTARK